MPKNTLFNYFVKPPLSTKTTSNKTDVKNLNTNISNKSYAGNADTSKSIEAPIRNGDVVWVKSSNHSWNLALIWNNSEATCNSIVKVYFFNQSKDEKLVSTSNISAFEGTALAEKDGKCATNDKDAAEKGNVAAEVLKVASGDRMKKLEKLLNWASGDLDNQENKMDFQTTQQKKEEPSAPKSSRKGSAKKYRKIIYSDDDEASDDKDEDYNPAPKKSKGKIAFFPSSDVSDDSESEEVEEEKPVLAGKKRKRTSPESKKSSKPHVSQVKSKLLSFQASSAPPVESESLYFHETLDFLHPQKIRDANGNRPDNPDYDNTTLTVPAEFFKKLTPAMYQWWTIKSNHFDVILFFKVGKFYELYHMDAVVGVKELGLIYMKGNFAHSGFPEVAFGRYSSALVQKGYSVARVEQTETPEQNAQRIRHKSLPKYEKTLRREVCRITTKGTQTYNAWQDSSTRNYESNFLLAVCEKPIYNSSEMQDSSSCRDIGVCFVDTSVGVFHLNQFQDDRYCSRFRTMISHYFPSQVLYERAKLSAELSKILHTGLASVIQTGLSSGSQFWDAGKCLKILSKEKYFVKNEQENWPEVLDAMKSETDSLGLSPKPEFELALSALGACLFYMKKCLIDFEVISMGQFQLYQCEDHLRKLCDENSPKFPDIKQHMVLDSATLNNLEIIQNSKGSKEGSLLEKLDFCKTPFGRRLLRQWVCSPPCHPFVIDARLDAIEDFRSNAEMMESLCATLSKMPDLERMLAQIHSLSKGSKSPDHPDSRAILYEEKLYSKRKINDFMSILEHYEAVHSCLKGLQDRICDLKSPLLQRILCLKTNANFTGGVFPDMQMILSQWKKAFDHKKAKESGKIIPNPGTNPEYDEAIADIKSLMERSEVYLKEQKKFFSCSQISFKGSGNKRFQLEIPIDRVPRIPDEYEISGQRKGFKSFRTAYTLKLNKDLEEAESRRDAAQADSMAIIFREFSKDYPIWNDAVKYLAQIDVLISFTRFSKGADGVMCRPKVLLPDQTSTPMLDLREGRHPCVVKTLYSESFIPNDTLLGCGADDHDDTTRCQCLLLTGPNMGGKSTLMRQVGLLVVLAQIGCYVPAQSCTFTACDRIFTRLGAFDRIMAGESTFFVELGETSTILKHATRNSLVLLDELGRGTSTYDGTAIASAVLKAVAENIQCRTVFSTHYRTLVDDAASFNNVQLGHMACMVEDGDSPVEEILTFLYKLASGACPKSYGFHAALLAGVNDDVVKLAHAKAAELESIKTDTVLFKKIFNQDYEEIRLQLTQNVR